MAGDRVPGPMPRRKDPDPSPGKAETVRRGMMPRPVVTTAGVERRERTLPGAMAALSARDLSAELAHVVFLSKVSSVRRLRGDLVGTTPVDPGPFPPGLRERVLVRDDHRCAYCGNPAEQVDHVIPRHHPRYQSASEACNAVAVCESCNRWKVDQTPAEWRGLVWADRWWRGWGPVLTGA